MGGNADMAGTFIVPDPGDINTSRKYRLQGWCRTRLVVAQLTLSLMVAMIWDEQIGQESRA